MEKLRPVLRDLGYWISLNVGLYPKIYFPMYARKYPFNRLAVNPSTEICIEGFPRSANSYAVYAFKLSNENTTVAHHLHVPAQVVEAIRSQLPTVLIIREPADAVGSFLVFQRSTNADIYLKAYRKFHDRILPFVDRMIVAEFSTVTQNFNKVITALNDRYGTNYHPVHNLHKKNIDIFEKLKRINYSFFGGDTNKLMYPDQARSRQTVEARHLAVESIFFQPARNIYEILKTSSI